MPTPDSSSLPFTSLFIDGQWVPSSTSSTFPIYNPSSPPSPFANMSIPSPGALFHDPSAKNVIQMITEAKEAGAQTVLGDLKRDGAFVNPHLIVGGCVRMRIWERESFGPVTVFAVVETIDEAVELVNATEYSLSASLWTKDVNLALDLVEGFELICVTPMSSDVALIRMMTHAWLLVDRLYKYQWSKPSIMNLFW
ncbi:hypothetical protein JAAARDRAFT_197210 [Jaapia argillacea MUCL 33604]|uniref:Aldehyde dehydrogenase domain-containing protein n=1 Tax=Jaapia argillacea MUCL 33604 TaxID=933084 RepID=A0A067PG33_9AGAM|nr:hypothetical protein JAAARDRAFT_197210 [Jaapia argillacea MUCL 33604]